MGQKSAIEWTDHTFNPWWGCVKVSAGCTHCYAETWANRYGYDIWGTNKLRRQFGETHWKQPIIWNQQAIRNNQRKRVFCASMADVFEDNPNIEQDRLKLWEIIEQTPQLDWLLLTKRPENILRLSSWDTQWPQNIWAMTSVEDQTQAEKRIPYLLEIPTLVRGLSVEPLLSPIDLRPWLGAIQWVIVGGESGNSSRPMHPEWVRQIKEQCVTNGVAFFFKQWGNWVPCEKKDVGAIRVSLNTNQQDIDNCYMKRINKKAAGRVLDGMYWNELPNKP